MPTQNPNPQSKIRSPNTDIRDGRDPLERGPERQASNPKSRPGAAEDVASVASGLAKDAGRSASKLASDAANSVRDAVEERKDKGARSIDGVADAVRDAADDLDGEVPYVAGYVREAADALSDFSQAIRNRSVGDLVDNVSDFARRQPTAFFAGSVLVGVVASRFLKSSAPARGPGRARSGPSQGERPSPTDSRVVGAGGRARAQKTEAAGRQSGRKAAAKPKGQMR